MRSNAARHRKLAAIFCLPSAAGLAVAGGLAIATVSGPMARAAPAEVVNDCLDVIDSYLVNGCTFSVEAVWCVENIDCHGGRLTNRATIHARQRHFVQGGESGNEVHFGACRGVNTISTNGTNPYSWQFLCTE